MNSPLRKLYVWMMRQARGKNAMRALFGVSVMESSFFPFPPDLMIIPMTLADTTKAWRIALVATLGSVIGGMAGYAIGHFLWDIIGQPIIGFYGLEASMAEFKSAYEAYGAWIIAIAGFTPIPFKLITIASGVFAFPFHEFVMLAIISRAARFYLVAGLLYLFGDKVRDFIEKRLEILTLAIMGLLVAGFVVVKWLL